MHLLVKQGALMKISEYEMLLLQSIYEYNRVPIWIFDSALSPINTYFFQCHTKFAEILKTHLGQLILKIQHPEFDILCFENEVYSIFSFEHENADFYLICGPMLTTEFNHINGIRNLSFAHLADTATLSSLVNMLPIMTIHTFNASIRLLMLILKKDARTASQIDSFKFSNIQNKLNTTFTYEHFENIEYARNHTPYSQELAILRCVKEGDINELESTYRALPRIQYGNMSHYPLKQIFYGSIANTTLVTRYAIEGGLEEETAFTLSDVYIRQMEACQTLYELNLVNEKMALDFTERVAHAKLSHQMRYSPAISKCMDFIQKNIHKKISLDQLAQEVHLSPKYLSVHFKNETGQTLSAYIEEIRIDEAKKLLLYSDYANSFISDALAFSSQSYFIMIFKKKTGMTPHQFRKMRQIKSDKGMA